MRANICHRCHRKWNEWFECRVGDNLDGIMVDLYYTVYEWKLRYLDIVISHCTRRSASNYRGSHYPATAHTALTPALTTSRLSLVFDHLHFMVTERNPSHVLPTS